MEYGGFWRRLGAFVVDGLIMLPVAMAVIYWGLPSSKFFMIWWLLPAVALNTVYNIYFVTLWGGTPGLLLFRLRIRMLDHAPVTLKAAVIRYGVLWTMGTIMACGGVIGTLRIDDTAYLSMSAPQIASEMTRLQPGWSRLASKVFQYWAYAEFFTLLFNKQRRALQDYMAGTVVVKASSLPANGPALVNTAL